MNRRIESSKEAVREWLQRRRLAVEPPPPIEQIQAELGWMPRDGTVPADGAGKLRDGRRK